MPNKYLVTFLLVVTVNFCYSNPVSCTPSKYPDLQLAYVTDNSLEGFITPSNPAADGYIVVRRTSAVNNASMWPVNGNTYNVGDAALGGTIISSGSSLVFSDSNLEKLVTYYYYVYPYNVCNGINNYLADEHAPAYNTQAKNDPCVGEDFESVQFSSTSRKKPKNCYYIEAPADWVLSKDACILDSGGNGSADSNRIVINNANDYIISPQIINPTIVEFWAKADNLDGNENAKITLQYSINGHNQWDDLPFYTVTGNSVNGDINTEWTRYIIDFSLVNESNGIDSGNYYIKWIFNGTPFEFSLDDVKIYCSGSSVNCPPRAVWNYNGNGVLGWWETDEDGNIVIPYNAYPPDVNISTSIVQDYDTDSYGDFETCSLIVESGATLNINSSATTHHYVAIVKQLDVKNGGTLLVQDKNSLIMVNNDGLVDNKGTINVYKVGQPVKEWDYTYWSSPVEAAPFSVFVNSNPNYIYKYVTQNFLDLYNNDTGGGTSGEPDGLDDDEPYTDNTYTTWNPDYDWQRPSETVMTPGEGYIVVAPSGGSTTGQEVTFSGAVNNGVIKKEVYLSLNTPQDTLDFDDWNLIGNPYPSAIDASAFLGNPSNINLIGGTAYLWTHTEPISESNVGYAGYDNFAMGDYSYFNLSGEVSATPELFKDQDTEGKIASGQSFMIEVIDVEGTEGTSVGQVVFNNSMRYGVKIDDSKVYPPFNNTYFYKNSRIKKKTSEKQLRDRIWLNLTESSGAFSQTLLGFFEYNPSYIENATDGIDRAYDALKLFSGNYIDIYSFINGKPFVIQGKTPLKNDEIIPLGITSNITGTLKISIDKIEGSLAEREVYLIDKQKHAEGEYHVLSEADYEFTVDEPGTFDDRFYLKFSNIEEEPEIIPDYKDAVVISNYNENIYFKSLSENNITQILGFDVLGRLIINKKIDDAAYELLTSNLQKGTVLYFKIQTKNNKVYNKKFIKL